MTPSGTTAVSIRIDGGQTHQHIDGFGASLTLIQRRGVIARDSGGAVGDNTSATVGQEQGIAAYLYGDIGLTRTRFFPWAYEPPGDWSLTDPILPWYTAGRQGTLQTLWTSYGMIDNPDAAAFQRNGPCMLADSQVDAYVQYLLDGAVHMAQIGIPLPYMAVLNEPDFCPAGGNLNLSPALMVEVVARLGRRLRHAGLGTHIVVTDGVRPDSSLPIMQAVMADTEARTYVGALAYHSYDGYNTVPVLQTVAGGGSPPGNLQASRRAVRALADQLNLPVWMSEVCYCSEQYVAGTQTPMSDFELSRLRLNHVHDELTVSEVNAFDVMNTYNIYRAGVSDELVTLSFDGNSAVSNYRISTYGNLLAHYSKSVLPGSMRIAAESSAAAVRVSAYRRPDGTPAIVVLNNTAAGAALDIQMTGITPPGSLPVVTSVEGTERQNVGPVPLSGAGYQVTVAPLSVTTLG